MIKVTVSALMLILIAGCTANEIVKPVPMTSVEKELSEAAKSTSQSLKKLAEVEQANTPKNALSQVRQTGPAGDLDKPITVSWVGPVQQLLVKVADLTGYKFTSIGREPAIPVIISIEAKNMRAVDVIRDAGLQSGQRAKITVSQKTKTIELAFGN